MNDNYDTGKVILSVAKDLRLVATSERFFTSFRRTEMNKALAGAIERCKGVTLYLKN